MNQNLLLNDPGEEPWVNVGNIDHYEYLVGPDPNGESEATRVYLEADDGGFEQTLPAQYGPGRYHVVVQFKRVPEDAAEGKIYLTNEVMNFERDWIATPEWSKLDFIWEVTEGSPPLTFRVVCGLGFGFLIYKPSIVLLPEVGEA